MNDGYYMKIALDEAQKAFEKDEVPVGAVLVNKGGDVVAVAHNLVISMHDPTAHAEMLVMRKGALLMGNYRLSGTTIYTTVEPCIMCMGAIVHARIKKVVFGTFDIKWGGCGSLYDFSSDMRFNHHVEVVDGVMKKQCKEIIQNFFKIKRKMLQLSKS